MNKNQTIKEIVINWHLTEACNYSCEYCFSKYNNICKTNEVHRNHESYTALLQKLYSYFTERYAIPVRLNLAGGEPLLSKNIISIIDVAKAIGFDVSIITNGSLLTPEITQNLKGKLSVIGVSIDSDNNNRDIVIGRCTRSKKTLDLDNLKHQLMVLRDSGTKIKINTVVCKYNKEGDLNNLISSIAPDKWKIFQVLPVNNIDLIVSEIEFNNFINRHSEHCQIMTVEHNELMTNSYIMIDPLGRFFQNGAVGAGYIYSQPILLVDSVNQCFTKLEFDIIKFISRYK